MRGNPAGVNVGSDPWRDENENPEQTDFVNLDQTLGNLMPSGSLSAYLKTQHSLRKYFQATIIPVQVHNKA